MRVVDVTLRASMPLREHVAFTSISEFAVLEHAHHFA